MEELGAVPPMMACVGPAHHRASNQPVEAGVVRIKACGTQECLKVAHPLATRSRQLRGKGAGVCKKRYRLIDRRQAGVAPVRISARIPSRPADALQLRLPGPAGTASMSIRRTRSQDPQTYPSLAISSLNASSRSAGRFRFRSLLISARPSCHV